MIDEIQKYEFNSYEKKGSDTVKCHSKQSVNGEILPGKYQKKIKNNVTRNLVRTSLYREADQAKRSWNTAFFGKRIFSKKSSSQIAFHIMRYFWDFYNRKAAFLCWKNI